MLVMIIRDGGATKVPREVADMDAVEKLREQGFEVEVVEPEAALADDEAKAPATKKKAA